MTGEDLQDSRAAETVPQQKRPRCNLRRASAWLGCLPAAAFLLCLCPGAGAQSSPIYIPPGSGMPQHPRTQGESPFGEQGPGEAQKRQQRLNAERQRELVAETARLVELVRAFNAKVQQGDSEANRGEQMRRLADIAKLAKSVKDKMTFSIGGAPSFPELPHFPP